MKLNPKLSALATTVVLALLSGAAGAQATDLGRVDARQERQAARIAQGLASGALTAPEARRLHREQKAIARAERHALADGRVTLGERRHLEGLQDRAARHIRRQKHDGQVRP